MKSGTEKVNSEHLEAEAIIDEGFENGPDIHYSDKDDRAYYAPMADLISIPDKKYFSNSSAFFRTLFHELVMQVAIPILTVLMECSNTFGDIPYSKEAAGR